MIKTQKNKIVKSVRGSAHPYVIITLENGERRKVLSASLKADGGYSEIKNAINRSSK